MADENIGTAEGAKTVLVTGATGLVGTAVLERLRKTSWKIRGMTHSASKTERLTESGCDQVAIGDVTNVDEMVAAADGVDAIIHSVGLLIEKGDLTYRSVNYGGTVNAIKAAQENGVNRFIMMSIVGMGPNETNPYASSKWDAEQAVLSSGLDYTMLRCSYVLGSTAPVLGVFKQLASLPVVPIIGNGRQLLQMIDVRNVAECLVTALDLPASVNQTVELCGPAPLTYDEVIDVVAKVHGRRPPAKVHFPAGMVKLGLPLAEKIPGSVVSRPTIDMLLRDSICDPRNAMETFGVDLIPLEASLRDAYGV